jgi:predicted nucleic acid-binding protein
MTDVVAECGSFPMGSVRCAGTPLSARDSRRRVWPPPFLDAQIAAVAAVHDATVVTGNAAHFEMFGGLRVENWLA